MRIAVCDDEEKYRLQAKDGIDRLSQSMDVLVETFSDGKKLLEHFDKMPYEVVFLDIEMPSMDGITLAKKLREKSTDVYIVFLTGHVEYAVEGYEVNALRYLTKPVKEDKLREVLRFVMDKNAGDRQFKLRADGEELFFHLSDLLYFEAQNQYVNIHTTKGTYLVRANIGDYEEELANEGFFRIHRGYLVALSRVRKLLKTEVEVEETGKKTAVLPVSRAKMKPLKEALYAFVEEEAATIVFLRPRSG